MPIDVALACAAVRALPAKIPAAAIAASAFTRAKFVFCRLVFAVPLFHWGATRTGLRG
jgi:hypothetical protein